MSISIQLTDEQAKQLAADIIKLNRPDEPSPLPELPTEPALPEPPEGSVILGFGKSFKTGGREFAGWSKSPTGPWGYWHDCIGCNPEYKYAAPIGSEIAKLNGLEPEEKPDTARREWDASVSKRSGRIYHRLEDDKPEHWELIRVREVLPGDPTPEQVEELVNSAETFLNNWTNSKNSNALIAALAPFRKP